MGRATRLSSPIALTVPDSDRDAHRHHGGLRSLATAVRIGHMQALGAGRNKFIGAVSDFVHTSS